MVDRKILDINTFSWVMLDQPQGMIQDVQGHSSPTITKLIDVEVTRQTQRSTTDELGYLFDA
ncbi:hypothetical protein ACH4T9_03005 [Micromonospora sp. NPDC020750]|uniref:hypothetical protein n=1 Tax=unclassified Micromonospora TaxID=2617518 RepID=UPI00378D2064